MTFSQVMSVIVLCVSVFLLAFAGWTFYRWRPKYFSAVPGYTRNIQHIPAGKKVEIHVPGETTVCKAGSRHGPLIYYEIVYRVDGKEDMLFHFGDDDDPEEPLPIRWTIRYRPEKPSFAYRDVGGIREGDLLTGAIGFLGLFLLVPSILVLCGL